MSPESSVPANPSDEVGRLKQEVAELSKRVVDLTIFVGEHLSVLEGSHQQLAKAALDAHDRLVALELKNFPEMHADLERISEIVPHTNPLLEHELDRRGEPPSGNYQK